MSGRLRHWKQHWDPTARLVFTKRMRMPLTDGRTHVEPGEELTPEIRAMLGKNADHRVRRWWEAKLLAIKEWQAPSEIRRARREREVPQPDIEPLGSGWYAVRDAAGVVTKVRGMAAAEELLAKMLARVEDEQPLAEGGDEQPELPDAGLAPEGAPGEIVNEGEAGEVIVGDQPEVPTTAAEGEQQPQE